MCVCKYMYVELGVIHKYSRFQLWRPGGNYPGRLIKAELSVTCFACCICLACVAKSLSGFEFNP